MSRIIVIGNSGSGKSYLASEIGRRNGIPVVSLDQLFWKPESAFSQKRPVDQIEAEFRYAEAIRR